MKLTAHLALAVGAALLGACYGKGDHSAEAPRGRYSSTWDTSFEGFALDDFHVPVGEVAEPVFLQLSPRGSGKYSVNFSGYLPFLVLDDFGFALGWYDFPLSFLDYAEGDFFYEPGLPYRGTFRFWGGVRLNDFDLGLTDVDLVFQLRTDGPSLESSGTADLIWDASLASSGSLFYPPGYGILRGVTTVAYRVD